MNDNIIKNKLSDLSPELRELNDSIICKVEVDLAGWLEDLSGGKGWEVWSETENENYISFFLKQSDDNAEVTLYDSGYASVDINGESVFQGDLIEKQGKAAKLSYYRIEEGEKILLN